MRRPHPADAVLAAAFAAVAVATLLVGPLSDAEGVTRSRDALGAALSLVAAVPVAWRRAAPLPSLAVAGVAALALSLGGWGLTVAAIGTWVLVGSAALHTDHRTARGLWVLGAAGVCAGVAAFTPSIRTPLQLLLAAGVGTLPPLVGDALRRQRELLAEVERLRAAELEAAAREERVRIARDLHDTVGHHLGAISLQARAGELEAGDGDADAAGASLAAIARLSDRAVQDVRTVLGVLREDGTEPRRPVPRLRDLRELAETAREAGVAVTFRHDGADDLPDPISTCAYRIAQEALTNVARHAGPVRASVEVARAAGRLRLTVTDDGPGGAPSGDGFGLAGMRERAQAVGGTVVAAPLAAGGWRVHADLPDHL